MHMDVCPRKASRSRSHTSRHVARHASTERGRERHPPGPDPALTDFTPTHRQPDYSRCLCKPSAPSPSFLTTGSPTQASPPQAVPQNPAQTCAFQGQSSLRSSPTTMTLPSQLLHCNASRYIPLQKPGGALGGSSWCRLCSKPQRLSVGSTD